MTVLPGNIHHFLKKRKLCLAKDILGPRSEKVQSIFRNIWIVFVNFGRSSGAFGNERSNSTNTDENLMSLHQRHSGLMVKGP